MEKNSGRRLARLRRADPCKVVEVWAEDEARLGLKPIARRVWSPRGRRPRSGGRTRNDRLYVYGFARPRTGQTFAVILPRVNTERMGEALAAFAAHADPGGTKVSVVLVDNAGWHAARRLAVPPNVVLHFLPRAPRSCSRPSRCGRWSGRRWPTARSAGSTASGRSSGTGWPTWPGTRRS